MDHEDRRGRGRGMCRLATRAGALVTIAALLAVGVTSLRSSNAGASALQDAQPGAAAAIAEQLAAVDAVVRVSQAEIPVADATVVSAAATATAANANVPGAAHLAGPVAGGSGSVVDNAADAILGDLAPERAKSAQVLAADAVGATQAHADELRANLLAATTTRASLLHDLEVGGHAKTRWSVALLDRLGFPVTIENLRALSAWIGAESNNARFRNPLATTMGGPGATNVNDVGVKSYPTDDIGLDATVSTLTNGLYEPILAALRAGDSAVRVVTAVAASPWGTGENAVTRLRQDG